MQELQEISEEEEDDNRQEGGGHSPGIREAETVAVKLA